MEWDSKENCITVVALHKCSNTVMEIFALLKPLKITKKFMWSTINRYYELCSVSDRPISGHRRTTWTPAVAERIRRNLLRKHKIMAKEMQIPQRTISRIIRRDLGLRAYRRCTGQLLTRALRTIRATRAK